LFDLNPSMCVENGFLEMLQDMVNDANPMVLRFPHNPNV